MRGKQAGKLSSSRIAGIDARDHGVGEHGRDFFACPPGGKRGNRLIAWISGPAAKPLPQETELAAPAEKIGPQQSAEAAGQDPQFAVEKEIAILARGLAGG